MLSMNSYENKPKQKTKSQVRVQRNISLPYAQYFFLKYKLTYSMQKQTEDDLIKRLRSGCTKLS